MVVLGILVILGGVIFFSYPRLQQDTLYIAVVGPMQQPNGQTMLNAVNLYWEEHKIPGKKIVVLPVDDENNADLAYQRAQEIAQDERILAVIGHRGSNASLRAGEVYQQGKIPALTGSSTIPVGNDWFFSVVFDNQSQGRFVADYIAKVLGYDRISLVYDTSSYGKPFAEAVLAQVGKLGLPVVFQRNYSTGGLSEDDYAALMDEIVNELSVVENPGMVVYIVHDKEGAELVKRLRDKRPDFPILEALITQTFYTHLDKITDGRRAQYLEGVLTTQTLIFDVGNNLAQQFYTDYEKKYALAPDASAAAYYDAAMLVGRAIEETGVIGRNPAEDRQAIRDYLASLTRFNPDLRGVTGYLYFDNDGVAVKSVPIGIYDNGKLISAPVQLRIIPSTRSIHNLDELHARGEILDIDGTRMYKTKVVYTGIDLNKISDLDMKNYSFTADFYLWFRYQGEFDEKNIEFLNADSTVNLGAPIASEMIDGMNYRVYRVKAKFKSPFNFRQYPFDQQTLSINFRHRDLTKEQLIYVRDDLRLLPKATLLRQLSDGGIAGWQPIDVLVYADTLRSDSTLGNPRLDVTGIEYSNFNADVQIQRDALNFSIKNLFPLVAVVILSYLSFFMPSDQFVVRTSLGINAIMTTAFFSLKVSSDLPPLGYLVALDYVFFMIYLLAIFVIILSIACYLAIKRNDQILFKRLELFGRIAHPSIILLTALMLVFLLR